ncbi:glycoside hydrolase family 61 protein [Panaeolus papilionaceus]|nr:glycoside hydrolase family 61 protein [Panaeolus papilionaceus]
MIINLKLTIACLLAFGTLASCHYTFPTLIVNGQDTPQWVNVRQTNNLYDLNPVKDVKSIDLRCYTSSTASPGTATVAAGQTIGFRASQALYHAGVVNVYMAKAPGSVSGWDGSGTVWFKVHEISAITNGGTTILWPATGIETISFTLPKSLPNGEYLVRIEQIALHAAAAAGGVEFYLGCGQVKVINGGSGTPGPLVAIPGVYTGDEPGIKIDIYYPTPASYTQPGPAVWRG